MPEQQHSSAASAALRRRSSISSRDFDSATRAAAAGGHTRGLSTSTSVSNTNYYVHSARPSAPDYYAEEPDFEDSVHLNNLATPEKHINGNGHSHSTKMGRGSAYSSLPTTSNGHDSHGGRRRNGSASNGGGGVMGYWTALQKWQKNALILATVLIVGLLVINSGKGPASTYAQDALEAARKKGGTATSEEDSQYIQRPDIGNNNKQLEKNPAAAHETGAGGRLAGTGATDSYATGKSASGSSKSNGQCRLPDGKPETQYALMIDAGSTGSRMHVYKFSNCLPAGVEYKPGQDLLPTLGEELFYPITPGLSSYQGNPRAAAESLRNIMEEAVKAVPKSERSCTPIAVKATAGLRLLGAAESQAILDEVERWLKEEWPFQVVEDGVVIMDGKDEGVYAWITINYLLGLVGPSKQPGQSAAVMDLGGASTQIVFEPAFPSDSKLSPGDHVYDLRFASTDHTLYQHSHLGYGLMQARRSVHNLVAFTHIWASATRGGSGHKEWEDLTADDEVSSPCLVKGGRKTVLLDPPGRKAVNVTLVGTGAGFDACRRVVDVVMAKDALCETEPCAFGGVYQPKLMDTFGSGPIYALSYFYDRIVPLGLGKDGKPFTIADLRDLTADVCAGPKPSSGYAGSSLRGWDRFKGNMEAMAELEDRPEYCLDLSFMYSLLSLGYELAPERELVTGKKINDVELGWALGAGIALLEHSSLSCRNPDA